MSTTANNQDLRAVLRAAVATLDHVLPAQAPLRDFVHHNTLHGFQHLPFPDALAAACRRTGARAWLSDDEYRAAYRNGRINESDLHAAIAVLPRLTADEVVLNRADSPLRCRDVYLAALRNPIGPLAPATLAWRITERNAITTFDAAVADTSRDRITQDADTTALALGDLWIACGEVLGLPKPWVPPGGGDAPDPGQLASVTPPAVDVEHQEADQLWLTHLLRKEALTGFDALAARVGDDWTLRDLLRHISGEDILDAVRDYLVRHLAGHLDLGFAAWRNPDRKRGFYAAWRASAAHEHAWVFSDLPEWDQHLERLPENAFETVIQELTLLGLAPERWARYLERLALELPGWSGMFLWRQQRPGYSGSDEPPIEILDYLAVRLVLERIHAQRLCRRHWHVEASLPMLRGYFRRHPAEFLVRTALYRDTLPEGVQDRAAKLVSRTLRRGFEASDADWQPLARLVLAYRPAGSTANWHGSAWPLYLLAQHLGVSAAELRAAGRDGAQRLLDCLARLDTDTRGVLWLGAYEHHYQHQIFAALAANHGRGEWPESAGRARAQLVFCMDDREEGLRRHLEEIAPDVQTFGTAGFFGVAMNWRGLDDSKASALCPVVVTPAHAVEEIPVPGTEPLQLHHQRRRDLRRHVNTYIHRASHRGLLGAAALTTLAAPFALLALVARLLVPVFSGRFLQHARSTFDRIVPTRVALNAPTGAAPASTARPRAGFTDAEQAERVRNTLRAMGLTSEFAPLVVFLGHGSASENNPHLAAYDCGACSGRHGGPNARVFAAMANRTEVRALLAAQNIAIPDDTWFVGAEHNTGDDRIAWYDEDLLPESARTALGALKSRLDAACRDHAVERCRRFASAPRNPTPRRAWHHVAARRHDFSQARPELGHVTNACALIGRRSMSRRAFFDRRSFLISYDPIQDPDGSIIESILLAAGPVGAGISLEYYFSTVNNDRLGCGTKVMHNVSGFLGVLEGTTSDLRTGLPRQMIEIHEAMRLLIVVEAATDVLTRVLERQPPLQELIGNGWVILAAKDPASPTIHRYEPDQGWVRWHDGEPPSTAARSLEWFAGHDGPLPPALLELGKPSQEQRHAG